MELDLAAPQLDPGMAGVAVEVRAVRAQAARLVDRRVTVKYQLPGHVPGTF